MKVNKRFCQDKDHIIHLEDGNYKQEEIIYICTHIDCKNRLVCKQCQIYSHDNHRGSLKKVLEIQLDIMNDFLDNVPGLRHYETFTYEKEQFKQLKNKVIDYLNDMEKQFIQLCKETQAMYDAQKVINLSKDEQILFVTNDELNNYYDVFYTKAQSSASLNDQYQILIRKVREIVEQLSCVEKQCKVNEQGNFVPQILKYIKQKTILEFYLKNPLDYKQVLGDVAQIKGAQFNENQLTNDKEIYYGELNNKQQKHGKGILIQIESQIIYEGIWNQNSLVWGQKTQYNENNECSIYRGKMKDKKLCGEGEKLTSTGYKYFGYFENDVLSGRGQFIRMDSKETYEGNNVNGKPHGRGKYVYANGDVYDGYFKNGMKHGEGELRYINGDTYKGSFQWDKLYGKGEFFSARQQIQYEGNFKDGKKEGDFKLIYGNGQIEQGKFYDDKKSGEFKRVQEFPKYLKTLAKSTIK